MIAHATTTSAIGLRTMLCTMLCIMFMKNIMTEILQREDLNVIDAITILEATIKSLEIVNNGDTDALNAERRLLRNLVLTLPVISIDIIAKEDHEAESIPIQLHLHPLT